MPQPMPDPYPPQPMPRPPMPAPEPRCYPQWKWECSGKQDDRIRTVMKVKKHCKTIRAKDCRIVPDVIEREFKVSVKIRLRFSANLVLILNPDKSNTTVTYIILYRLNDAFQNHFDKFLLINARYALLPQKERRKLKPG